MSTCWRRAATRRAAGSPIFGFAVDAAHHNGGFLVLAVKAHACLGAAIVAGAFFLHHRRIGSASSQQGDGAYNE